MAILKRQPQENESRKYDSTVDDFADIAALIDPLEEDEVGSTVFVASASEVYMKTSTGWRAI